MPKTRFVGGQITMATRLHYLPGVYQIGLV